MCDHLEGPGVLLSEKQIGTDRVSRLVSRLFTSIRCGSSSGFVAGALVAVWMVGCSVSPLAVRPVSQSLDVRLDPSVGGLVATSVAEVEVVETDAKLGKRFVVEIDLHPDLVVTSVEAEGATVFGYRIRAPKPSEHGGVAPATIRLAVEDPEPRLRLHIAYQGRLWQDVSAGEIAGRVHNFDVQAHVGEEGVYLEPAGFWYPRISHRDDAAPGDWLTTYELVTEPIEGSASISNSPIESRSDFRWRPYELLSVLEMAARR